MSRPRNPRRPVMRLGILSFDAGEAIRLISACGRDAADRRMRAAGRRTWNRADYNAACRASDRLLRSVGIAP